MLVLAAWAPNMVCPAAAVAAAQAFVANHGDLANGGDVDLDFTAGDALPLVLELMGLYTQAVYANPPLLQSLTSVKFGTTVVTCPTHAIRWTGAVVETINFLGNHSVLTGWVTDWTYGGVPFPKPEWCRAPAHSHPITITTGGPQSLDVELGVQPANASPEYCHVVGDMAGVGVAYEWIGQLQGGLQSIRLNSTLANAIGVFEMISTIQWRVRIADEQVFDGGASTHRCFGILGVPILGGAQEDGATLKRMAAAVQAAGQARPESNDISFNIICGLWPHFPDYVLAPDLNLPAANAHPTYFNQVGGAWPIADAVPSGAECQAIVRFVKGVLNQIGSPAQVSAIVVWADPGHPDVALEAPVGSPGLGGRTMAVGPAIWYAALADGPVFAGQVVPQGTRLNNYEACLRYAHGGAVFYFPGGVVAARPSAEAVLHGFTALVWTSMRMDPSGNPVQFCEQAHYYGGGA